jgi:preprotein translocase subunit SecA
VTGLLARVELAPDRNAMPFEPSPIMTRMMVESHPEPISALATDIPMPMPMPMRDDDGAVATLPVRTPVVDPNDETTWAGTPRNAQCPCGSGKKYKHCHGRLA